jgi:hypothetical protein
LGKNQNADGAVNDLLSKADTLDEILLLIDDGGNQLGGIDLPSGHLEEVSISADVIFHDLIDVIDLSDGGDGEGTMLGTDKNGLSLIIGDAADAQISVHGCGLLCEFGSERSIFDVVDGFVEAIILAVNSQTCPAGA